MYITTTNTINQGKVLADLLLIQIDATIIMVGNQFAIDMAKNPVYHGQTKHISIKFHVARQAVKEGEVQLVRCSSDE